MDQEDTLDFKALRAKFQEDKHLLTQPRTRPALPEKPQVVPPQQSSPHYLPAGARPSLLSSISQSPEGRLALAPRVIFKDDKKESKKPLIQINTKGKDKSEAKLKKGKEKMKGSKEKLDDGSAEVKKGKEKMKGSKEKLDDGSAEVKKKNGKDKKLPLLPNESAAELVPATPPPPPPATVSKKKGFLGFMKSMKSNSMEIPAEPILDAPSSDPPGLAPLIPAPSDFTEPASTPPHRALLPNIPTFSDSPAAVEVIPPSPDFIPPPDFIPDFPALEPPTLEIESPLEIETPSLPVSRPASRNEIIPDPPSTAPTPPPSLPISPPSRAASTPSPSPPEPDELAVQEAIEEAVNIAEVEAPSPSPPAATTDPASVPPSPKPERPISALSFLSRAEDMTPVKRTSACDQRVFNALEKARRKSSPLTNPSSSYSITPPLEELPPSPTYSLPELPPIDYAGNAHLSKPVNGFDPRQTSPVLEGITEEGSDGIPELLVVPPPPPPKRVLPDPESLGPAPEKPSRPDTVDLSQFNPPPPVEDIGFPAPHEFSETDTMDVPEFNDVASDAHSHSEWGNGEHTGPDTPDAQNLSEFYDNVITPPGAEANPSPTFGDQYNSPEPSFQTPQDSPPQAGLEDDVGNGVDKSTENVYESIPSSANKKKVKSEGGKKRKGPPKNPYAEAKQETKEEKTKTGRFGKSDKKAAAAAAATATATAAATAAAAEGPDEKELKKKEKQRLEKEKKELKEKQEREKKEQKEREKKENEMKKKFKLTGQEDALYQANVTVTNKGRKNDLPVNCGDVVSIIRTTNCPKGKWLARDGSNNYGYIAVDHVELDIKEMLELGKKAATIRNKNSNVMEEEVTRSGSRASNQYPMSAESFTDDSEEWTGDDDETLSPTAAIENPLVSIGHTRTASMPDMGNKDLSVNHVHSRSDISAEGPEVQSRHEALQKLATFFHSPKPEEPAASGTEPETSPVLENEEEIPTGTEPETSPVLENEEEIPTNTEPETSPVPEEEEVPMPEAGSTQEMDFDLTDMVILPPPDLYADFSVE